MKPEHRSHCSESAPQVFKDAPARRWEIVTLVHVGGLILLATWFFGGGSTWSRLLISSWGSLGLVITLTALATQGRANSTAAAALPIRWLWPVLAFNALVLASCFNPSFSIKTFEGEILLAHTGAAHAALPSTAHVATSLQNLWLFDALYFSAFNLVLIRRRSRVRGLLLFACANAVLLSVFGTLQKLVSDGLFFGAVKSPNTRFFATFVYGNHWAAFVVLLVAATGGLIFRHMRRHDGSSSARSKTTLGVIGLLVMAITPFIAGSRAGGIMVIVLLSAFGMRVLFHSARRSHAPGMSRVLPVAGIVLCGMLIAGGAAWLGREALSERWNDTRHQWQGEMLSDRRELYRDTWHLVSEQPVFGWGFGSFGKIFQLIRPRPLEANRQYERSYGDAHSDWLQALAEVGFVGTTLIGLCAALPLLSLRSHGAQSTITIYALAGCALIALYAIVEFPFGNPAVVLTWWTCFFSAVQYARLRDSRAHSHEIGSPSTAT